LKAVVHGHLVREVAVLLLVVGLAAIRVPPACAQGTIAMRWNSCDAQGLAQIAPVCFSNLGESRLDLSVTPAADITQVVGWALVVDFVVSASPAPAWWRLDPTGCRFGQLIADLPDHSEGGCQDLWSASGAALVQSVIFPRAGDDSTQFRAIVGVSVPASRAFTLTASQSYLGAVLGLHWGSTLGAGACAGCATAACIRFNSAEIQRLPGAPGPSTLVFSNTVNAGDNEVQWGTGVSCAPVPVRARTWGQLKAVYR
jgi:hypothetical protein